MDEQLIQGRLAFLKAAEALKDTLRSGHTAGGRSESTAEHSWRLCLLALAFEDQLPGVDMLRLLKLCIVHDLGEAIHGDIPAVAQVDKEAKQLQERQDMLELTASLDAPLRTQVMSLWEEYDAAETPEARLAKALDKLETVLQHNQGKNPPGFDYAFNLGYGQHHTAAHPLTAAIRAILDRETCDRMNSGQ
ncbi:HD family hydrolase [Massilia sp. BSC265]|uniref:HD domain-containing protein n=1 Tax=Massilia sp. BSC265 TaxID=1549812 RepID=UPI0004E86C91|nr:HD domain-containing protein [Massilia sp. BSC265]KFI07358.1 phosphohydrolase [Massilia sp. BSC265]